MKSALTLIRLARSSPPNRTFSLMAAADLEERRWNRVCYHILTVFFYSYSPSSVRQWQASTAISSKNVCLQLACIQRDLTSLPSQHALRGDYIVLPSIICLSRIASGRIIHHPWSISLNVLGDGQEAQFSWVSPSSRPCCFHVHVLQI
jgi:hypothetical protein